MKIEDEFKFILVTINDYYNKRLFNDLEILMNSEGYVLKDMKKVGDTYQLVFIKANVNEINKGE